MQVTGGIKAVTGGINVAGGNLVLGSTSVAGTLAARPAAAVANRIYIATDTNEIYRDTGAAWNKIGAGSGASATLSSLTAASAANTIANSTYAQAWNWALTSNITALSIGETSASTGGSGTQYLQKISTLSGSTAIPFSVVTRGTEAFRVDSVNPQLVANSGSLAAPSYSFATQKTTGLYLQGAGQLAASVAGSVGMLIDNANYNTSLGYQSMNSVSGGTSNTAIGYKAALSLSGSSNNTAIGYQALKSISGGGSNDNTAVGYNAISTSSGTRNTALGANTGPTLASGSDNTLIGNSTDTGNGSVSYGTALGAGAIVGSSNTIVLGRTSDSVAIGQTTAGSYKLTVNGTAGGTSGYVNASDVRFKTNITPVVNALTTIKRLQGVHYEFNRAAFPQKDFESGRQLGFIAQQIEQFVPEVVRTDTFGFKGVQYAQLVPLLAEGIKEQQLVLQHLLKKDPTTLLVDIKTFQGNDAVFANIKATNIKTTQLDAEKANIAQLEAKYIRADVVKSGEVEVFVSIGSFQPIFNPQQDAQYIVNATADDGSNAFASVAFMSGKLSVAQIGGKGVNISSMGTQVGLVASGKKIKATWIRMS